MNKTQIAKQLIDHFGMESLVAKLPQREVVKVLGLVTAQELADSLGLSYSEFRWRLKDCQIPHPSFRLVRRCYYRKEEAKQIRSSWKKK